MSFLYFCCFKQKTAYEMRISDWSSDVCSSDLYLLEHLPDDQGPALEPGQKTRGGIGVIDTQARNPLWAFVKYRLGARALTDYAGIYDQNSRGQIGRASCRERVCQYV